MSCWNITGKTYFFKIESTGQSTLKLLKSLKILIMAKLQDSPSAHFFILKKDQILINTMTLKMVVTFWILPNDIILGSAMLILKYFPSFYEILVNAFLVVNTICDQGYLSQS